jgi:lipopolysaccharide/colanic/teichoic acid biosynthesis glycosyltransferase
MLARRDLSLSAPPVLSFPGSYTSYKAVVDVVLASILLILTAPLILLTIALVRLSSTGPGIYAQVRLGRGGRPYKIYKIRTMTHDCERQSGPQWSTAGDPRVTALGRLLRRTHLDELPQLWNVLRGEMSLVGPRPERPVFVRRLETAIPSYRVRMEVLPGITGLAQVQFPPDEDLASVQRKVACDAVYVASVSFWLDARILLGTVFKVAGAPYEFTRRVLCLPGMPTVPHRQVVMIESDRESISQLQTV